jgi:PII-like signaling protein
MLKPGPSKRLIITVDETSRWHGRSLYLALLELFRHRGLSGATVTRAIAGFSGGGPIHTTHLADVVIRLPVRIELVESPEAIERVLPDVYDIVEHGLVELQDTQVVKFVAAEGVPVPPPPEEALMRLIGKARMLQVHIGQDDQWEGRPLHEAIVQRARQLDIAGATAYRGILGYGAHKRIHKHKSLTLSHDDPILVTVIDTEEKINGLLAAIDGMVMGGCLIAISDVTVVKYAEHPDAGGRTSDA